jgi:hypothetical protein
MTTNTIIIGEIMIINYKQRYYPRGNFNNNDRYTQDRQLPKQDWKYKLTCFSCGQICHIAREWKTQMRYTQRKN